MEGDQLLRQARLGAVFVGLAEGPITFMPTYKFEKGERGRSVCGVKGPAGSCRFEKKWGGSQSGFVAGGAFPQCLGRQAPYPHPRRLRSVVM